MPQFGWIVDLRKCNGCNACAVACKSEMNTVPATGPLPVRNTRPLDVNYRAVLSVVSGSYPSLVRLDVTMACNHCSSPACVPSCPTRAIQKDGATGLVRIDAAGCVGCRYCEWACPYGAPRFNESTGKAEMCTGCAHKLAEGAAPACVSACPTGALQHTTDFSGGNGAVPPGFADPASCRPNVRFLGVR